MDSDLRYRDIPSAPAFVVPKNACDCHAHVFGDAEAYPLVENRSYTPHPAPLRDYVRMLDALGISRAVLIQPSIYGLDNSCLLAMLNELGLGRARGIAAISEDTTESEIARLHEGGIRGIRLVSMVKGGAHLEGLERIAARIAPFNWHIEVYAPSHAWPELAPRLTKLPTNIVIDHMGRLSPETQSKDPERDAVTAAIEAGRCWIKLCGYRASKQGYPYADVIGLARYFLELAPELCVWGTDWPHPNMKVYMPDDGMLLNLLAQWAGDGRIIEQVLVDNPAVLYKF